jgi:co-chaperonin GroES (HSP10)
MLETEKGQTLEVTQANTVYIEALDYYLEAPDNKIIIASDPYESGYECKTCNQTGRIKSALNPELIKDCPDCHGKGKLLEIPDNAKVAPTSGTIVSIGEGCKIRTRDDLGRRVLIGPYVGSAIPIKGNIRFRVIKEDEFIVWIWRGNKDEAVKDKDFIDYVTELN